MSLSIPRFDYPYPDPPPCIGFVGLKQSGKDTAADYLAETYGYKKLAFADPMREMALRINPVVGIGGGDFVDEVPWRAKGWGKREWRYADAVNFFGYEGAKEHFPEVRHFLQVLGTDAVRSVLGEHVWIDHLLERAEFHWAVIGPDAPIAVTDVRFPNEVEALKRVGFSIVRILRPGTSTDDTHASETALAGYEADVTIPNDGPLEQLYAALETIVHDTTTEVTT